MQNREAFEETVLGHWAERFRCTIDDLKRPGTVLIPEETFAGSAAVHVWVIGRRAFARMDPALEHWMNQVMVGQPDTTVMTGDLLREALGSESVLRTEESLLRYLYPPDFRPAEAARRYVVRTLTADDANALAAMKEACTPDEVEEGEVSVEDEIGFGCFDGDRLVAVATGFRLTGFMDIGVLTDPAYRRQGLGRAVVSALCAWCLDRPTMLIAQYRCLTTNTGSDAIARSLGFSMPQRQQSIYLQD